MVMTHYLLNKLDNIKSEYLAVKCEVSTRHTYATGLRQITRTDLIYVLNGVETLWQMGFDKTVTIGDYIEVEFSDISDLVSHLTITELTEEQYQFMKDNNLYAGFDLIGQLWDLVNCTKDEIQNFRDADEEKHNLVS